MTTMEETHVVVHPLDDVAEVKCSSEGLGRMEMTRAVRISLWVLRGYLVGISALLLYRVLAMAGVLHGG